MRRCILNDLLKGKISLIGAEVGVWEGDNAYSLFNQLDVKKLYLIDPYENYTDSTQGEGLLERPFDRAKERARVLVEQYPTEWLYKKSVDAVKEVKEKLDFVYIDADHQYEYVIEDLETWYPKLKKGATMAGHDYNIPDVKRAVDEFCENNNLKLELIDAENEWWFIK